MNAVVKPRVEAAFGALPLAENPTWTDLTSRLRSASTNSQLGEEGTADLVLDNRDRALEPEYSASPYYPNVIPNLRMRLTYKEPSANLLDYDTSTGETGFGDVVAFNATLARTTAQAADGSYSFQVTATASTFMRVGLPSTSVPFDAARSVRVTPGATYTIRASSRPATTARTLLLHRNYYTADGTLIGPSGGTSATGVLGTWVDLTFDSIAPAGAAYLAINVEVQSPAVGEVHYVDKFGVLTGPSVAWVAGTAPAAVIFDGYVDKIIPAYRWGVNGGDAVVTVKCTDLTKILARHRLRPPYDTEVLADNPLHWWPFGDAAGLNTAQDAGSSPATFNITRNADLGAEPVVKATNRTSLKVIETTGGLARYTQPGLHTVEVVLDGLEGSGDYGLSMVHVGPIRFSLWNSSRGTDPVWDVQVEYGGPSSTSQVTTAYNIPNNRPDRQFVIAVAQTTTTAFQVYLNGVFAQTLTVPAGSVLGGYYMRPGQFFIERAGWDTPDFASDNSFRLGHVSIYNSALSAARILAHANAARTPWEGDSTGGRVGRILDAVGLPVSMRDVDTGATTGLGYQLDPVEGTTALALLRQIEDTEFGRMFASGGKWVFKDRRSLDGTTAVAVFGDGGGTEVPYSDLVEDFSEDHLVRTATVTRQGGNPQTHTDPAATTADATFGETRDGLLYATDGEAYDAAGFLVSQGKTPALRFEAVTLKGERSSAVMNQVAARRIGDKVTVRRRPPGGGAPQEKTVVIEGVSHDINLAAPTWHATYRLSPADTATYWTLEDTVDGLLDSTTVLAF